jgi:hypothetical protein
MIDYERVISDLEKLRSGFNASVDAQLAALREAQATHKKTFPTVMDLVAEAAKLFGNDPGKPIFSTASFQTAHKNLTGRPLGDGRATQLLATCPRVVRLVGACHWVVLPGGLNRHES